MLTPMRQNPLGRSGLMVSAVGLGCNNFGRRLDRAGTRAVIDAALDALDALLETADIYGGDGASERLIGDALEGRRDRVVLASKFGLELSDDSGEPRGSRAYARRALEASLERLRTDWIDLFYYHEPDGVTALAETLGALGELADEGRNLAFPRPTAAEDAAFAVDAAVLGEGDLIRVRRRLDELAGRVGALEAQPGVRLARRLGDVVRRVRRTT